MKLKLQKINIEEGPDSQIVFIKCKSAHKNQSYN